MWKFSIGIIEASNVAAVTLRMPIPLSNPLLSRQQSHEPAETVSPVNPRMSQVISGHVLCEFLCVCVRHRTVCHASS